MLSKILKMFSDDMSVDLGTANTLIYIPGQGMVLNEPSVVALRALADKNDKSRILAVGKQAKTMLGRTSNKIQVIRPLKDGVVADFTAAGAMLQDFIRRATRQHYFSMGPRVLVCVPFGATEVERKAIKNSAESAGARKVYLAEEPLLAALGAGLPIKDSGGQFLLDIGGGTSEMAVLTFGDIVVAESLRVGGDHFNNSIIEYVRHEHNLQIGEASAENLKHTIGTAYPASDPQEMQVRGRNRQDGTPHETMLARSDMYHALEDSLKKIASGIKSVLEKTSPDLISDIQTNGITVTGGGALLHGIDKYLKGEIHIPVHLAEDPLGCVARGGLIMLENEELYDQDHLT